MRRSYSNGHVVDNTTKPCPRCGAENRNKRNFYDKMKHFLTKQLFLPTIIFFTVLIVIKSYLLIYGNPIDNSLIEPNEKVNVVSSQAKEQKDIIQSEIKAREFETKKRENSTDRKREQCIQEIDSRMYKILEIENEITEACQTFSILSIDSDPITVGQMRIRLLTNNSELVKRGERLYDECYDILRRNSFDGEALEISTKKKDFRQRMHNIEYRTLHTSVY